MAIALFPKEGGSIEICANRWIGGIVWFSGGRCLFLSRVELSVPHQAREGEGLFLVPCVRADVGWLWFGEGVW